MAVVKLTQRLVDDLLGAKPPGSDQFYWSSKYTGLGVKHSRHGKVTWVMQWRDGGRASHRMKLGVAPSLTLEGAIQAHNERCAVVAAGRNPLDDRDRVSSDPTFREYIENVYKKSPTWSGKAETTKRSDEFFLAPIVAFLGDKKLATITFEDVQELHHRLVDPKEAQLLARAAGRTVDRRRGGEGGARRALRLLRAILSRAVKDQRIFGKGERLIEIGADGARGAEQKLDEDAYGRLWRAIGDARANATTDSMRKAIDIIALLALTGARKSEVSCLRWRHLSIPFRQITLPLAEHKTGKKTGLSRVIALSDEALEILGAYPRGKPDDLVFEGEGRDRPVALHKPWKAIREAAELPNAVVIHSLRHGVGTALAAAGEGVWMISQALGHRSLASTQRYIQDSDPVRHAMAAKVVSLIGFQKSTNSTNSTNSAEDSQEPLGEVREGGLRTRNELNEFGPARPVLRVVKG